MTNFFLSFLGISVSVSFIIAFLLLIAPFLNKRYAAKWKYWIWVVLALRLIIPFGVNDGKTAADIRPQVKTPSISESEEVLPETLVDETALRRVIVEIPTQMTTPIVTGTEKADSNISVLDMIAFVWALGVLLFLSVHLISYFYYKRQILRNGRVVKDKDVLRLLLKLKRELHIKCTVHVMEYSDSASPMMIGFWKHILVLPAEPYDSEEMYFILKHELIHLKRRDVFFKLLFVVANAVHWFNPLIWIMQKEAAIDMELSCDERVTKGADYATRKAYTETLLSTLHKRSAKKTVLTTQFYGGKQIMKKRFKNILEKTGKKNGAALLICAVILIVSLGTLVGCSIPNESDEQTPATVNAGGESLDDTPVAGDEQTPATVNAGGEALDDTPVAGDEQIPATVNAGGEALDDTPVADDEQLPLSSEESYKTVLLDNGDFVSTDIQNKKINLQNIKEAITDDDSVTVAPNKFAILDLNNDGEREVVLWIQINGISDYGFEILRYQEGTVYGYTLPYRAFMELKTDGTFIFSGGAADQGIGRLSFSGNEYAIDKLYYSESQFNSDNELEVQYIANGIPYSSEEFDHDMMLQGEKSNVQWYDLTADNVNAVLE